MKSRLVVIARNVSTEKHGTHDDKGKENKDFCYCSTVSPALCNLRIVWKLYGNKEREIECKNDIDERVAPFCHCVEKEHTKNGEKKGKLLKECEYGSSVHIYIIRGYEGIWT